MFKAEDNWTSIKSPNSGLFNAPKALPFFRDASNHKNVFSLNIACDNHFMINSVNSIVSGESPSF